MYQKINPFKLYSSVCVNVSTELCNNPLLIPDTRSLRPFNAARLALLQGIRLKRVQPKSMLSGGSAFMEWCPCPAPRAKSQGQKGQKAALVP